MFFIICWLLGIRLFNQGYKRINLAEPENIPTIALLLAAIGLLLILLPFLKRLKIGELEIERELAQTQDELKEFKTEIRNTISVINTQISTVSSIKNQNQMIFYSSGGEEAKDAIAQTPKEFVANANEMLDEFVLEDQDTIMGLMKVRIQIEYLLRKILNKRLHVTDATKNIKFMSLLSVTKEFLKLYPNYLYLESPFSFVRQLANTAAHAQRISDHQAKEAIDIGVKIIATLKHIADQEDENKFLAPNPGST